MPPDYFAQDLANIMRIPSTDRIHIHAMLAYPDSQVCGKMMIIVMGMSGTQKSHILLKSSDVESLSYPPVARLQLAGGSRQGQWRKE